MSIMKRDYLYVSRKWQQSLILFLVLLVVCTSALIGFAILKASHLAAANLRQQMGGTFSMEIDMSNPAYMQANTQDNREGETAAKRYTGSTYAGKYLDHNVIGEVMKTSGISEYIANI